MAMVIYFIYFFVLILIVIGSTNVNKHEKNQFVLLVMCILTWLLIGLRDVTVGADTMSYVISFDYVRQWSFSDLLLRLSSHKEQLYTIITWVLGRLSSDYTIYLLGWALFPAVALYVTCRENLKNTTQYFEAILVMYMLGLYAFFVAGIRQTAAISIVLISYKYLKDSKLIKFLCCIAVAYFIHNSVLIFLIAYPLRRLKVKWWFSIVLVALYFVASKINIGNIVQLANLVFDDRFGAYGTVYESTQNASAFIIQFVIFLIAYVKIGPLVKNDESNNILLVLATIGLFFQSLSGMLAEMSRLSFYFCVFDIILLPRALAEFPKDTRAIGNTAFIFMCLILLLAVSKSNLPLYKFA